MTTAARPTTSESCHWYAKDGTPVYEVPRAKGEGTRPTTLADARKMDLLPSVTTILGVLRKPQLETWLIEQSVLACLTTPRPPEEPLDAFIERVLHTERIQDQESDIAKKRGIEIHDAIETWFSTRHLEGEICQWVQPIIMFLEDQGRAATSEFVVVSADGYAGKVDLVQTVGAGLAMWDFKTTKKLPKSAYLEHRLQLSAYANAYPDKRLPISTGNIYISTVAPGQFIVCEHQDGWVDTYLDGFTSLLSYWQWANNYYP